MNIITKAILYAEEYYIDETLRHSLRVDRYVSENPTIKDKELMERCIALAFMHDLVEDTDIDINNCHHTLRGNLDIITRKNGQTYMEYIKRIKDLYTQYPEAYYVKLADIKDHLNLTTTLTDSLKNRYVEALAYLL